MPRHLIRATLIAALALAWPAAASAQSLAELAKKTKEEKEEKADKSSSSDTITARDLRRAGRSGRGNVSPPRSATAAEPADEASAEGAEGGDAEGGAEEEQTPEELREQARADWSQRMTAAEAEVTRLEGRVAELQQSLANPGVGSVEQRAQRAADLEAAQAELAAARQNVTTLQREGRQNGYRR